MKVHELNKGDRIRVYKQHGDIIRGERTATVIGLKYSEFKQFVAEIEIDGLEGGTFTISDEDYFDLLPIRNIISEDCENNTDIPSHYQGKDGVDVIEFLRQQLSADEFKGFMAGNIIKYATRLGRKDDEVKELEKIEVYAKRLKEVLANE